MYVFLKNVKGKLDENLRSSSLMIDKITLARSVYNFSLGKYSS